MRILITGGTGLIGTELCKFLGQEFSDVEINILTRNKNLTKNQKEAPASNKNNIKYVNQFGDLKGSFEVVINLAGEPINKGRWSEKRKSLIFDSRISITQQLVEYLKSLKIKPKVLISGSAIGYYGSDKNIEFKEDSSPAEFGFTHQLCHAWEQAANEALAFGIRVVNLRTGIVLAKNGGIIKEMLLPFKLGLGCRLGDGSAWMSWIHIEDLCEMIIYIIKNNNLAGPINATSPYPVTNREFTNLFAKSLKKPSFLVMPEIMVKIIFGEMGESLLLRGQKVIPNLMLNSGFQFKFAKLNEALENLILDSNT